MEAPPLPSSPTIDNQLYFAFSPYIFVGPSFWAFVLMLCPPLIYLTYKDYNFFLSLGPGGTPYNFKGYLTITFLRLFALSNPLRASPVPEELQNTGFLQPGELSRRDSARPCVLGIAPHRQMNQRPEHKIYEYLSKCIKELAKDHPRELRIDTSTFEKHCAALFSDRQVNTTKMGEVCHSHDTDGSMHMTLHPEDIKTVIEAGWGERHPLSRGGWCKRFVPQGFVMVYAPRSEEEVETVMKIIKAGVCWVRGEQFFTK